MGRLLLLVIAMFCASAPAFAQSSAEDKLRDQLRTTVMQLRELQDQQAMLQAQKVAAEQERDAARKELAALRGQAGSASADRSARAALQASVAQYKGAAERATEAARQKDAERARIEATLVAKGAVLDACMAKNTELYRVGLEILDRYRQFGVGDALAAREPFIGLKRVELENLAQNYDDRLYGGQFDPRTVQTATPTQPPAQQTPAQPAPSANPNPQPSQ